MLFEKPQRPTTIVANSELQTVDSAICHGISYLFSYIYLKETPWYKT